MKDKEDKLFYISCSKLRTFEQCKHHYKLKYIDFMKPTDKKEIYSLRGSLVHYLIEKALDKGYECDFVKKNVLKAMKQYLKEKNDRGIINEDLYKSSAIYLAKEQKFINEIRTFIDNFYIILDKLNFDRSCKFKTEYKYAFDNYEKGYYLDAYLDLIYRANKKLIIVDWKTQKEMNAGIAENTDQTTFYSYISYKRKGIIPEIVIGHLKTGEIYSLTKNIEDFKKLENRMDTLLQYNKAAKYKTFNKSTNGCFFCEYKTFCNKETKKIFLLK